MAKRAPVEGAPKRCMGWQTPRGWTGQWASSLVAFYFFFRGRGRSNLELCVVYPNSTERNLVSLNG
eukprot:scaffold186426_cov30-Tisochrysis_lutea.AAC.1